MNTISFGNEQLITPKELAAAGVMSLVTQWSLRKSGQLSFSKYRTKVR